MKKTVTRCAFAAIVPLLLAVAPSAFAFSRVGHETIAQLAYQSTELSPKAKAAIDKILSTSDPVHPGQPEAVTDAAEWPDEIKSPYGAYSKYPWAKSFIAAHPNHHLWHFVNFPVGSSKYDPTKTVYAVPTDIVHSVEGCIAILEGKGGFDNLTQLDALRYLLHLVGDAHQPLHTITGYFDVHDPANPKLLPANKPIPATAWKDSGGNGLSYGAETELHAAWDDVIVNTIAGKDTQKLVSALSSAVKSTSYTTSGDYHNWITAWVSDSMTVASAAYGPLKFDQYKTSPQDEIVVTLPSTYIKDESVTERTQIIKGATHLLQLLNAIHWAN